MKTLVKILLGGVAAIAIIILFALSLLQSNQINKINTELSHISDQIAVLSTVKIPATTTPTDVNPSGTVEPTNAAETIKVKLYYKNTKTDPEMLNCEADTFVYRTIPKTAKVLTDTLNALITNKLTAEEKAFGLSNPFEDPAYTDRLDNFSIKSVSVNSAGVATVTLDDPDYFTSGGSCRVSNISTMFELTSKQFSTVDDVQFLPLDVMQP